MCDATLACPSAKCFSFKIWDRAITMRTSSFRSLMFFTQSFRKNGDDGCYV